MSKTTFHIQISCTTGFDDNEEEGVVQVYTFSEILHLSEMLKHQERSRMKSKSKRTDADNVLLEDLQRVKEEIRVPSGEDVMSLGEIIGIECFTETDTGITARLALNDVIGIKAQCKIDQAQYASEYRRKMDEAKKLAREIMKL